MASSKYALTSILLILSSWVSAGPKIDIGNELIFHNDTGGTIRYIFIAPRESEHWGTDVLGSGSVLLDGDSLSFYVHYPKICERFDIIVIGETDNDFARINQLICNGSPASIRLSEDTLGEGAPDFHLVEFVFDNYTGCDIHYLFVTPADSGILGVDQLGASTLLRPELSVGLFVPTEQEPVRFDVVAVDESVNVYSFDVSVDPVLGNARIAIDSTSIRPTDTTSAEFEPAGPATR